MFKRLFWLMIGAGFGFGVSFWLMRFVRSTVEKYSPEKVSNDVSHALKAFGQDLKAAVSDGRDAMRDYERELRDKLESNGHSNGQPRQRDLWLAE
jgi:hypothetical protein